MSEQKVRTMEEFAAATGLSRPTVSKYFDNPDNVKPSTRARIEKALKDYDYRPTSSQPASTANSRRTSA